MERHHAARAKRMDLLGDVRREGADQGHPHQEGHIETLRRHAPPLLLGWLPASIEAYTSYMNMPEELKAIHERNARVEADKAWETSLFRRALIAITTYIVVALVLSVTGARDFLAAAFIPALGYLLSTLTFPALKK